MFGCLYDDSVFKTQSIDSEKSKWLINGIQKSLKAKLLLTLVNYETDYFIEESFKDFANIAYSLD